MVEETIEVMSGLEVAALVLLPWIAVFVAAWLVYRLWRRVS